MVTFVSPTLLTNIDSNFEEHLKETNKSLETLLISIFVSYHLREFVLPFYTHVFLSSFLSIQLLQNVTVFVDNGFDSFFG